MEGEQNQTKRLWRLVLGCLMALSSQSIVALMRKNPSFARPLSTQPARSRLAGGLRSRTATAAVLVVASLLTACSRTDGPAPVSNGVALRAVPANGKIVVHDGDTVYSVARQYNLSVRSIIDANHLQPPYQLTSGSVLLLPVTGNYVVEAGDSLGMIARKQGVGLSALARANGLQAPYVIHPGQTLILPSSVGEPIAPSPAEANRTDSNGKLVLNSPNSPGGAAANGKKVAGAKDGPGRKDGGVILPPPPPPSSPPGTPPAAANQASVPPPPANSGTSGPATSGPATSATANGTPTALGQGHAPAPQTQQANAAPAAAPPAGATETPPAAAPPPAALSQPPALAGAGFIWPLRGRVLLDYGSMGKGQMNDGINIAAERGTPVKAAENGVVAYAGNELRGFGNLLLIKHAGGWMTAYAHNDELLVSRGDTVRKGQVIAKVGSTGGASEPQLHFEIRKGTQAVDPTEVIKEKLAELARALSEPS